MYLKTLLSVAFIAILLNPLYSQMTKAKPEEWKDIKSRPLIVELLKVHERKIERWEKKRDKTNKPDKKEKFEKRIKEYKKFIEDYNAHIKTVANKYFDYHPEILFMSYNEVDELRDKKSKKYTVLWYSESTAEGTNYSEEGFTYALDISLPTLNYARIEESKLSVDYSFYLPYTIGRGNNEINLTDLTLAAQMMKRHIEEIVKSGNKRYTFKDYAKDMAEKNCEQLENKTVHIAKTNIDESTNINEINQEYVIGKVKAIDEEEYKQMVLNEEDVLIGVPVPWTISKGSLSIVTITAAVYMRVFMNPSTGEIYSAQGVKTGQRVEANFRRKEFSKHDDCK